MRKPMIVAHRGAPLLAKENTLASFAKAIECGADMIEFDVRRTKDGILVVHHDPAIDGHPLSQLTHREANELAGPKGVVIPTVAEVLKLTRGKIKLDVELKEMGYEQDIMALILTYFKKDAFVITSFHDQSLATVKQLFPKVKTGLLLGFGLLFCCREFFPERRCRKIGADLLIAHYRLLKFGFLNRACKNHKPVYVWTVDDPKLMENLMADVRIEAIITNKPDQAVAMLKKSP